MDLAKALKHVLRLLANTRLSTRGRSAAALAFPKHKYEISKRLQGLVHLVVVSGYACLC